MVLFALRRLKLCIWLIPSRFLQTDKALPKGKKKMVYFLKPAGVSLATESIDSLVIWGDVGETALDVVGAMGLEVLLPLMRNQMKQQGTWHGGGKAAEEVTELLQDFAAEGDIPHSCCCGGRLGRQG